MAVPAGLLRETVRIEYPQETRNSLGESVQTWLSFGGNRRAYIEPLSYSEQNRRQQIGGTASHLVRLRYVAGLTGQMRLVWLNRDERVLYISSIVERGHRDEQELTCEEQAS